MHPRSGSPKQQLPRAADAAASLVNSARRRLQYSQLPVRNRRPAALVVPSTPLKPKLKSATGKCLVNSLSRFTPKRKRDNASACPRRSLSMIDLNLHENYTAPADLRPEAAERLESSGGGDRAGADGKQSCSMATWTASQEFRESRAASLVCRALAINAWRKSRSQVAELRTTAVDLGQQLEHLQLQIVVLRKLLDKENARVSGLAGELHRTKSQIDDLGKERDQLKADKEAAENEAQRQRDISDERQVAVGNLRNELRTVRDQLEAVDAQIARDRDKLLKLREDKKILLEKLSSCETLASDRGARAEKAELALEDAQVQLHTQMALANSLQEEVLRCSNLQSERDEAKLELEKTIKKLEEEKNFILKQFQDSKESEKRLRLRNETLENQLLSQELKIQEIESAFEVKLLELNELQDRFLRQTQETGWSSRVLQLAGSVARAPRVILRTLSFFSTGMPIL